MKQISGNNKDYIYKGNYHWNEQFEGKAILNNQINYRFGEKCCVSVLKPKKFDLEKLEKKWKNYLKSSKFSFAFSNDVLFDDAFEYYCRFLRKDATGYNEKISYNNRKIEEMNIKDISKIITNSDSSITNRSSISIVIYYGNKKLLFLADNIASEALEDLSQKEMNYSLVKLPHHGSESNIDDCFIKNVETGIYLVSTNSEKYNHPDLETLAKIACKKTDYVKKIYFNYKVEKVVKFEQNFEKSVQGLYPFVVGGIEGVEDNRIHLSELHAPYTQAGWDVKKMDDVLDGNWSVKVNGLTQRNTLAYQTIPQNFRFEPGVTYKVSFDYQTGSDDTYGVVVGTGEYKGATRLETLKKQMGPDQDGHYERLITGDMSGQTWFGIYSTGNAPDLQGTSGSEANFGGYKEIVLDNLVIERVDEDINKETLQGLIDKAEGLERTDYDKDAWKVLADAVVNAKVAVNKDKTDAQDIQTAYYELKAALDYVEGYKLDPEAKNDISVKGAKATAFSEDNGTYGSNIGKASYVLDGNTSTAWMTAYSGFSTTIKNNEGWIDIQYPEPHTVDGLRYLPGPSVGGSFTSITTYEISVKTADSDEYQVVATGDWANTEGWKTAEFAPVENVTNIKLLAKAANPTNWWAVASEIRATSKSEAEAGNKPGAEVVNKDALNKQIEAVKALDKDNYAANDAWKTLEAKLAAAEKVSADKDATTYDVKLALANLKDALGDIQLLGADYSKVDAAIAKVPADLSIYTEESVAALNEALRDLDITKQSEVDKMAAAIKKAIANLKIAHADGLANEAAEDGNWYVYKDGSVDTTYTGLAANTYGWWYVEGGKVNFNATGLVANEYGWWYVQNGTIDFGYTGLAANEYGWWYVEGGKINFEHTGLVANEYGWWYVEGGKINFNYTGSAANEYAGGMFRADRSTSTSMVSYQTSKAGGMYATE